MDWTRYYVEPEIFEPILLRAIDDAPKRYSRIWLVLWPTDALDLIASTPFYARSKAMHQRLLAAMDKRYRLNSVKDFFGGLQIRVRLYDRTAP